MSPYFPKFPQTYSQISLCYPQSIVTKEWHVWKKCLFLTISWYSQFSSYPQYFIKVFPHPHKKNDGDFLDHHRFFHIVYNVLPFVNVSDSSTNLP